MSFSVWRSEEFPSVGVAGAGRMRLCSSVLLLQLCGDFIWWPTEYPNYCSQWPFVSISDLLCWVTPCAGSASRADVSTPWLKLLPLGPSYGTFWFKMLYFSITTEVQHLACLHIMENDDWNERPHITASEATYEHLKMLCPKMWALLGGKGVCCSFHHPCESLNMLVWQQGWKKVDRPCCLFIGNTRYIWNRLHLSAVIGFLLHRCAYFF